MKKLLKKLGLFLSVIAVLFSFTACEMPEPTNPEKEPLPSNYFLPTSAVEYNGQEVEGEYSFNYAEDLHGFTATFYNYVNGHENYSIDVKSYSFNEDYSKLNLIYQEYEVEGQTEKLVRQRKYEYEFFENNSYTERCDEYDTDLETYVFQYIEGKTYNENGKLTLYYYLKSDAENTFYYYTVFANEYDENGYLKKEFEFDVNDGVTYLQSVNVYTYAQDYSSGKQTYYYYSSNGYTVDSYTDMTAEIIDDIRYETQVIHYANGTTGNTNVFGYDKNNELVYVNYGGLQEEARITKNQYNQITNYSYSDESSSVDMQVRYKADGGNIFSSSKTITSSFGTITEENSFTYTDAKQISGASKTATGYESFNKNITITYGELKCDELLKHIELYDSLLRYYADNVLVEGI